MPIIYACCLNGTLLIISAGQDLLFMWYCPHYFCGTGPAVWVVLSPLFMRDGTCCLSDDAVGTKWEDVGTQCDCWDQIGGCQDTMRLLGPDRRMSGHNATLSGPNESMSGHSGTLSGPNESMSGHSETLSGTNESMLGHNGTLSGHNGTLSGPMGHCRDPTTCSILNQKLLFKFVLESL
jgi:hypothetical protein